MKNALLLALALAFTTIAARADYPLTHTVTLTEAGTLAQHLGEYPYSIIELTVAGPVNAADFETMWDASLNGKLYKIDMSEATVADGIIPAHAFYHADVQLDKSSWRVHTLQLKEFVFPNGVTEIGDGAFQFVLLEQIHFPAGLKRTGSHAFYGYGLLTDREIVFPEGFEEIGDCSFYGRQSLKKVVLPESVKRIGAQAFNDTYLEEINFPEGLEEIGTAAFATTKIKDVVIPASFNPSEGDQQFLLSNLSRLVFQEGTTSVPEGFALSCRSLSDLQLAQSIETIGRNAFANTGIGSIYLTDNVRRVEASAYSSCLRAQTLVLSPVLESLSNGAFGNCTAVTAIYCKNPVPAVCEGDSPFYALVNGKKLGIDPNVTVFVPAGSVQAYSAAFGWDYFHNFVETDEFPASGVENVAVETVGEQPVYDLQGRRVAEPRAGQVYIRGGRKFIVR